MKTLTKKLKQKWIEALRSGKYAQGKGQLKREVSKNTKFNYCFLGVLEAIEPLSQVDEMKEARIARLKMKEIRVNANKIRIALKEERKEIEDRARKEREAAEEVKEKKDQEKFERKVKAAPDKRKLLEFAEVIDKLILPELKSKKAQSILSDAKVLMAKASSYIREKTSIL